MAISEIRVISIIGVISSLNFVVKTCGESCSFQPDDALSFYPDNKEIGKFSPVVEENPFNKPLKTLKQLARSVDFSLKIIDSSDFDVEKEDIDEFVNYSMENLGSFLKQQQSILEKIKNCEKSLTKISHFVGKNIDLDEVHACCYLKSRFGRITKENFEKTKTSSNNPYILFFPFTSDDTHYWGVYFCPIENLEEIDLIFSKFGFEKLDTLGIHGTPEQKIEEIGLEIKKYKANLVKIDKEINHFLEVNEKRFLKFYTKLSQLKTYFDIKNHAFKYSDSFILVGWILAEKADSLKEKLEDIQGVEAQIERAEKVPQHEIPVKLKNKGFFKPFESFTRMYGVPNYEGFDPTPLLAVTYTIIFGIMFGDVGQGLVLSIGGYLAFRLKKMVSAKILIFCGILSVIFGFVYGSFFGFEHALDPLYKRFFGMHEKPIEVMLPENINRILLYSIAIGCVLISMAICVNIFYSFKRGKFANAILSRNGVAGLIFYLSAVLLIVISQIPVNMGFFLFPYIFFLMILPLTCIFLRVPLGKQLFEGGDVSQIKWGEYLIESVIEILFETILGFLSNTLSFLRIGVFVLVHAGMMSVVFGLAEMCGGVGYCAIIVLGNILVLVLEALLVSIQVMRLEFYELFSRFFGDTGSEFRPVVVEDG
ncbi:MAG: ATPase [Oscillospiraceae bacterium]|nr:ATPase [Oscillospiraceae bacterium]